MVSYPQFWILLIGGPFASLFPDFMIKLFSKVYYPNPVEKVILAQKEKPYFDFSRYLEIQEEDVIKRKKTTREVEERKQYVNERK